MGVEEGTINSEGAEIGEEIKCFKIEPVNNGFGSEFANDSGDGSSGASESLRTYKRRRQLRSSSITEVQDGGRASIDQMESSAWRLSYEYEQKVTLPFTDHCASLNDSNYRLQRKWRNVVLENMHQFLSGDEGGIRRCIQDALVFHQENDCNVTVKDSDTCHEDKQNCSPQAGQIPNGNQHTAEELEEKFTSLCKLLLENFQGIKLDNLFHLSLINSRMKDGEYERSPMLFASDIQEAFTNSVQIEVSM
ncbi:Cysteine--tRNA ligase [Gossypium arboreum]|uniref:Cysteine--tRNA ligase n=1 Tax=Gossypium arboreum TaxID=29729 RepID=A0A0B0NTB0_GOSAR|nr:Cysteine--tRNA ligase [Gossypium arboreum]